MESDMPKLIKYWVIITGKVLLYCSLGWLQTHRYIASWWLTPKKLLIFRCLNSCRTSINPSVIIIIISNIVCFYFSTSLALCPYYCFK